LAHGFANEPVSLAVAVPVNALLFVAEGYVHEQYRYLIIVAAQVANGQFWPEAIVAESDKIGG
jgi:hypothetical protein